MILDENLKMDIKTPVRVVPVGNGGEVVAADEFEFKRPTPQMARDTFGLVKYFTKMQRGISKFLAETTNIEEAAEQAQLRAGSVVEAVHKEYADDNPEAREAKLKEIQESVDGYHQMLNLCDDLDVYQMTADFGKMVVNNKRCVLRCKKGQESESPVPLSTHIWEHQIEPKDRLDAVIRYCCFFGLTSSTQD